MTPAPAMEHATVDGVRIAYQDVGAGPAIVLLHGNPTSSFLWRGVLPSLAKTARCIAPDLAGMGQSDPLPRSGPGRYRFVEHRRILEGLLAQLDLGPIVLFGHDWGSVLGVDWARRHANLVRGIVYLETLVSPLSWAASNAPSPELFRALRGPDGDRLVLKDNIFIEVVLQAVMLWLVCSVMVLNAVFRTLLYKPFKNDRRALVAELDARRERILEAEAEAEAAAQR